MNILLVYPQYPDTFWSFKHALKFISKKAAHPPLGLLTIAPMLPKSWNKKLVDMNVEKLSNKHFVWADYIFISAMAVQEASVREVISRSKTFNKIIVAGGPLFTEEYDRFPEIDHFVLNEAELTLDQFIHDINAGIPKRVYMTRQFASLVSTPIPDYSLLNKKQYASISLQFTRGCPYDCEFCDITALLGHQVRCKSTDQIIGELEQMKSIGWKGNVLMVDDNFIGNKQVLKNSLLPAMIKWMELNNHPFDFSTEASINLADDPELMSMMVQAGFISVFVGIESPEETSLAECNKVQNKNRVLLDSIQTIQQAGLDVQAGFIVGFDNDPPTIFRQQIDFIQQSGIISAMVGLLNAPRKTKLYQRLEKEGRILTNFDGDNTNASLNFIPRMDRELLLSGYRELLDGIYSINPFYKRVRLSLSPAHTNSNKKKRINAASIKALFRSMLWIGLFDRSRFQYWILFFETLFTKPRQLSRAITYSIYGYHYRKVFEKMK